MWGRNLPIAIGILAASPIHAQSTDKPSFEVACVKPSGPKSVRNSEGGPGTKEPERFVFTSATLHDLVFRAYGLVVYREQISGPSWIENERYDIVVKMAPGTTKEQYQQMLQNLLAERFGVVVHHETKRLPGYELVIGKHGSKFKKPVEGSNAAPVRRPDGY